MNDIVPEGPVPTNVLAKQGVAAIGNLIGGVGLLILGALPPIVGIIAGAVVGIIGAGALLSKDSEDRKPGIIMAVAGSLSILSKIGIIRPVAATLLGIGAFGLLALGIRYGIKFLKGLKSRS
ncbi:MAG: hypothetical protein LBD78_09015 [Spirochaetaceae bacterium]|jgi:hypothetical protein|nr:hypothetical protein [Spirochaetaceae bacterium]